MRPTVRRCLGVAGALAAAGAWIVVQSGIAGAAPARPAARAVLAHPAAAVYVPASKLLIPGMRGPAITNLQRRLAQLHYYPGPVDGEFGLDTLEAVWAFKEVQGIQTRAGADDVGAYMEQRLVHPRQPVPLVPRGGQWRVEVNLSRGYLILYRSNQPELISHISPGGGYYYPCPGGGTCGPAITPDGNFRAHWFAAGWVKVPLGAMYNPVFFIGSAYAIHGDVPVPLAAVSHGCVRVPMDVAAFFHRLVHLSLSSGTPIYIRGHVPGT